MSFLNKVVLVTGGSAGIGATTAEFFAKEGATVAIVGRNEAKLNSVAERCKKLGGTAFTIKADISTDQEADTIVKKTIDKFGKLDVLVNNAGILRESSILGDSYLETFDEVMNTNIRGTVRITRFAVPHLIKTKGTIINVSSVAGLSPKRLYYSAYRTSKAALNHFSACIAAELAPLGVRVNAVSPGPVRTDIFAGTSTADADAIKNLTALNRVLETDEIANMILYLASDKAKGITGSNYVVDNGYMLK